MSLQSDLKLNETTCTVLGVDETIYCIILLRVFFIKNARNFLYVVAMKRG